MSIKTEYFWLTISLWHFTRAEFKIDLISSILASRHISTSIRHYVVIRQVLSNDFSGASGVNNSRTFVRYSFDRIYLTTTTGVVAFIFLSILCPIRNNTNPVIHKIIPAMGSMFMPKRKAIIKNIPVIYKGAPTK